MPQEPAIINHRAEASKKCFRCGFRNVTAKARCVRCNNDLSLGTTGPGNKGRALDKLSEVVRLRVSVILILAIVVLLGLVLLYVWQDPQAQAVAVYEASVEHPATQQPEQSEQSAQPEKVTRDSPQSEEAGKHVLAELQRFQGAIGDSMNYDEYEEMLTRLKTDVDRTLPSFVDHNPDDMTFRWEVEGAIRDYTAAGNWWKTAIRNSSVLTEADRTERLTANWTSAKTHLDNAERVLVR